ncbi:hypothetical protein [Brachybacterium sp. GPGPB12]|uniref:hypothetical protein n=1 Tax=Brachybacterium sp. GPGPB12 TaxID=3023517 RepID=UPI0031345BD1
MPSAPRAPALTQTRWLALLAAFALLLPALPAAPAAAEVTDGQLAEGGVSRDSQDYRVAPGLDLTTFSRLEEGGWKEGRRPHRRPHRVDPLGRRHRRRHRHGPLPADRCDARRRAR